MNDGTKLQTARRNEPPKVNGITRRIINTTDADIQKLSHRMAIYWTRPGSQFVVHENHSRRQTIMTILAVDGDNITIRFWDERGEKSVNEFVYRAMLRGMLIETLTANMHFSRRTSAPVNPVPLTEEEMTQYISLDAMREYQSTLPEMPDVTEVLWLEGEEDKEELLPLPETAMEDHLLLPEEEVAPVSIYQYMYGTLVEDGGYLGAIEKDEPATVRACTG